MIQGGVHPARRLPVGVFPFGRLAGEFTAVHSRWVYIRRVLAVEDRGSCMRYVTVRAEPPDGSRFHPLGAAMAEQSAVTPGPIHQVEMVDGGTGVSLTEIRAGLDCYRDVLAESPYVLEYAATGDDSGFVYTHFELDDLSCRVLEYRRGTELMIEMPMEHGAEGTLLVTLVGETGAFADAFADVPAEVDVEVLETGEYDPAVRQLFDRLTARQQDVLATAVAAGYYDDPRQATHADLAAELDLSPGTVGEHLRKVEARVFSQFAGEG